MEVFKWIKNIQNTKKLNTKCKIGSNPPFDWHCLGIWVRSRPSLSGSSTCKCYPTNPARLFSPEKDLPGLEVKYDNDNVILNNDIYLCGWNIALWWSLLATKTQLGNLWPRRLLNRLWIPQFEARSWFIIPAHWCILGGPDWINLRAWGEFWNFPPNSGSRWLPNLNAIEAFLVKPCQGRFEASLSKGKKCEWQKVERSRR